MHACRHTYILHAYPREIHRVELALAVEGLHVNLTQDRFDFEIWQFSTCHLCFVSKISFYLEWRKMVLTSATMSIRFLLQPSKRVFHEWHSFSSFFIFLAIYTITQYTKYTEHIQMAKNSILQCACESHGIYFFPSTPVCLFFCLFYSHEISRILALISNILWLFLLCPCLVWSCCIHYYFVKLCPGIHQTSWSTYQAEEKRWDIHYLCL